MYLCKTETDTDSAFLEMQKRVVSGNPSYNFFKSIQVTETSSLPSDFRLRTDSSKFKLQIKFCCLCTKHYLWFCKLSGHLPSLGGFITHLKHIHEIGAYRKTPSQKVRTLTATFVNPRSPLVL